MSLSLTRAFSKLQVTVNAFSALNRTVVGKRNFSRTLPNKFFFGKKPDTSKFTVEKISIPNQNFKMGVPQKPKEGTSVAYEPNEIKDMLKFLMGVMPRSSNLISTVSSEGVPNVAPYALCTCVSINPPVMSLTVSKKPEGKKDTENNIDETKEFAVNIVTDNCIESSMVAGAEFPHNVSEFEKVGFTQKASSVIKAPLVAQCPINIECKLLSRTPLTNKEGSETAIIYNAEIVKIHANNSIYNNSTTQFDYEKFGLVSKLGGPQYARISSIINIVSE